MDRFNKYNAMSAVGLSDRVRSIVSGSERGLAHETDKLSSVSKSTIDLDSYEDEEIFTARLDVLGCSREVFLQALDHDHSVVSAEDEKLGAFFSEIISSCPDAREWVLNDLYNRTDRCIDLGMALPSLQYCARNRLRKSFAELESHSGVSLPDVQRRQGVALCRYLTNLVAPVLVTEMHALRLTNGLRGQNSSNRFKDFVIRNTMDTNWVSYFFREYPVLLRLCINTIENRVDAVTEIAHRYAVDYEEIVTKFGISSDDQVVNIEVGMGDTHQEGRTVATLHFASGARLIYKPRSLQLDICFMDLLNWLASNGLQSDFGSFKILERQDYAWTEFIQNKHCHSKPEVERFFYRQGAILAVLHMLGGYDMIHENVIASGEYPYCIDVECAYSKSRPIANVKMRRSSYIKRLLMESVTTTGMLPSYRQGDTKGAGFIGGGLAVVGGQTRAGKVPGWIHENTDQMQQVFRTIIIENENTNLPHLDGEVQNPLVYIDEILGGFETAYHILMNAADKLVDTDGPIAKLMDCTSRVLFRPTSVYSQCQNVLLHPDSFINGLDTTIKLEAMWRSTSETIPPGVVQSELDQLWNGDVPFFVSNGSSRDVMDHRGHIVAKEYFVETGQEKIKRRLTLFGEADLALQLELIKQSICLLSPVLPILRNPHNAVVHRSAEGSSKPPIDFIGAAEISAERILSRAYREEDEIGWIGPMVGAFGTWKIGQASSGLYDGLSGYCMFYLYMYEVQQKEIYRNTAILIWNQILRDIEDVRKFGLEHDGVSNVFLSGYHGLVSVLYVMSHMSAVLGDSYWDGSVSEFILDWVERRIPFDQHFDFLLGSAGGIPVLLDCFEEKSRTRGLEIATACGEHLLKNAIEAQEGICWSSEEFPRLGGFAHGTAGIMYSLYRLGEATSNERYLSAAARSLDYDRSLYSESQRSWRCLLDEDHSSRPYWCHGSAGIALSRMLVNEKLSDPTLLRECRIARDHILKHGLGEAHCLCHGDFGNLEVLQRLAVFLDDPELTDRVTQVAAARVSTHLERNNWQCGIHGRDIQLHSMLGGTLGVAYSLLRLAAPEQVPSILHLAPPIRKGK